MALIGKQNELSFVRKAAPGWYLDGGTHGEILLPGRYVPDDAVVGQLIDVFVYRDSEDRLVATTERPFVGVGEFACLRVLNFLPKIGAFLDWGLQKDLFLPARELAGPLQPGDWVVVYVSLDEKSDRLTAHARLDRWLDSTPPTYAEGESVRLLIEAETPLGYNAIVNQAHRGLLYRADLAGPLKLGQSMNGFVRSVRPDGKIDLALDRAGYGRIAPLSEQILEKLKSRGGRLPFHDHSSSPEIRAAFGVSKKAFKQAIGGLYREKQIEILPGGIALLGAPQGGPPVKKQWAPRRNTRGHE